MKGEKFMFDEYEKRDFDESIYDGMLGPNEALDDNYLSDDYEYDEREDELKEYIKYSFAEKAGFEESSVEVEIDGLYSDIEEEFTVEPYGEPGNETFLMVHIKSDVSSIPDEPADLFTKDLLYKIGKEEEADNLSLSDQYSFDLCLKLNLVEKRICVVDLNLYTDDSYKNKISSIEVYNNDESLEEFEGLDYENAYMSLEEIEEEVDFVLKKLFEYDY